MLRSRDEHVDYLVARYSIVNQKQDDILLIGQTMMFTISRRPQGSLTAAPLSTRKGMSSTMHEQSLGQADISVEQKGNTNGHFFHSG